MGKGESTRDAHEPVFEWRPSVEAMKLAMCSEKYVLHHVVDSASRAEHVGDSPRDRAVVPSVELIEGRPFPGSCTFNECEVRIHDHLRDYDTARPGFYAWRVFFSDRARALRPIGDDDDLV